MPIDRVTLQILADHCRAATESMAQTLFRTAHSTFVKETEDFTTGLATPSGKTFASPYDLGATWFVGLDYARAFGLVDSYEEGDLCMTNDPYSGFVCTHSPDVHLWKPIFHEGKLVCFSVGHIHNTDVGGAVPASLSRANVEVHQEGIRIPPVKLYKRGELNREVLDIMLLNVRMREQNWGDLKAEIAAMHTGERRVHEMIRRFGVEVFREGIEDLLDYAERQARNVISRIPEGEYFFADYMDEDSVGGYPARIAVNLVVKKDELVLDFSESDPQVTSSLNLPTGGDPRHVLLMIPVSYVLYTMDPSLLLNCGLLRAASCILPRGSIVNPEYPAAVGMRTLACIRLQSAVFGAFAQALPDLVPGACGDGGPLLNVRTFDTRTGRRLMANLDPITGGGGAISTRDGTEGSGANFGFLKNAPVEINEAEVPVKILGYGLARDSGGAGRYRGGGGTSLEFEVTAPDTVVTARNRDRSRFTPWGSCGGGAGKPSSFLLNPGTPRERDLGNTDVVTLQPGDVIRITSAGAGGWGDPLEREPERVLEDVRRGFVSVEAAREEYGVVIRDGAVAADETNALRAQRPRSGNGFGFNEARIDFERIWTRETYAKLIALLTSLPVEWRFFVKHRVFEEFAPGSNGSGTPEAVERVFRDVVARFPQLGAVAVAGA
jgi:N-methylhydantoinase B